MVKPLLANITTAENIRVISLLSTFVKTLSPNALLANANELKTNLDKSVAYFKS